MTTTIPIALSGYAEPIDAAAELLAANMRSGYTDGYEYELTDAAIAGLTDSAAAALLDSLLLEHLTKNITGVVCLLDETLTETYDTAVAITALVRERISVEGDERGALRQLFVAELVQAANWLV